MEFLIPSLLLAATVATIVGLNIRYRAEMAKLTPEQRAEENERLRQDGLVY